MEKRVFKEPIIIFSSVTATAADDEYTIEKTLSHRFRERGPVLAAKPRLSLDQGDVKTYDISYYFSDGDRFETKTESKSESYSKEK